MKKLNLDVDALVVESFDSLPAARGRRGTVNGNVDPMTAETGCQIDTGEPGCQADPSGYMVYGCALSDDDGTCYISQCGGPGCYSEDLVEC